MNTKKGTWDILCIQGPNTAGHRVPPLRITTGEGAVVWLQLCCWQSPWYFHGPSASRVSVTLQFLTLHWLPLCTLPSGNQWDLLTSPSLVSLSGPHYPESEKKSQTMMPVMDVGDGKPSEVKLFDHKQSCPRKNHTQSIAKTHWPMLDNPAQPSHPYSSKDALANTSGPKLKRPFSDIPSYILNQYIIFCHWISRGEWPVIHL